MKNLPQKVAIPLLVIGLTLGWPIICEAQDNFEQAIVLIRTQKLGNISETGSGIILGFEEDRVFILTAQHVISQNQQISIQFFHQRNQTNAFHAEVVRQDELLDMAVLVVKGYQHPGDPVLIAGQPNQMIRGENVVTIGHPQGHIWDVNLQNIYKSSSYEGEENMLSISGQGIFGGASGGVVLNKIGEVVGMLTETNAINTGCLKVDAIIQKLSEWPEIPHNLFLTKALPTNMVYVIGGQLRRGETYVDIPSFLIDKFEVSNADFCHFLNEVGNLKEQGSKYLDRIEGSMIRKKKGQYEPLEGYENHPAILVNWYGAVAYAKWAGKRLPTEEEWEYAAKGGGKNRDYIYAGGNTAVEVAVYGGTEQQLLPEQIGSKKANQLGIYDMSGNVMEWCENWSNLTPINKKGRKEKALRGGCWYDPESLVQVQRRFSAEPFRAAINTGFRCVQDFSQ